MDARNARTILRRMGPITQPVDRVVDRSWKGLTLPAERVDLAHTGLGVVLRYQGNNRSQIRDCLIRQTDPEVHDVSILRTSLTGIVPRSSAERAAASSAASISGDS